MDESTEHHDQDLRRRKDEAEGLVAGLMVELRKEDPMLGLEAARGEAIKMLTREERAAFYGQR